MVNAVKQGALEEPLTTEKIRVFCKENELNYSDKYINVFLPNGTAEKHSLTYQKPFVRKSKGEYVIKKEFL